MAQASAFKRFSDDMKLAEFMTMLHNKFRLTDNDDKAIPEQGALKLIALLTTDTNFGADEARVSADSRKQLSFRE